ncbi:avidin/streptavidin family protein [Azospirillum soli]|uniref:avidin/streptavidin family protein n=1 Tax=Azospirillum soli TaxID=1304799 RepID=UPI001AE929E9|nr:avidin/streptavidin family protein [Azospirillum soli]MBP2312347.1 hypothetical protein [Azospirillum soli]
MREMAHAPSTEGSSSSGKFRGVWRNELNSTMTLTVTGAKVEGTYESPVSTSGGPARGDVTGFVHGDHISFVVNWSTGSLTAWVGQLVVENGREVLQTLWQMIKAPSPQESAAEAWKSIMSGTDQFHR